MSDPYEYADQAWRLARLAVPGMRALLRARLSPPLDPRATARLLRSLGSYGVGPSIGFAGGAARHPDDIAVIDAPDTGSRATFAELESRVARKADALAAAGFVPGTPIGLLGRNSLAYVEALAVLARLEADIVYLNTGFPADRITDVCQSLAVCSVLADGDLAGRVPSGLLGGILDGGPWQTLGSPQQSEPLPLLHQVVAHELPSGRPGGRHILLTSGTTGRPKGAPRTSTPLDAVVSLLSGLPYRQRDTHVMAAPVFHAWGWLNHRLAALLDTTEVMMPRSRPLDILAAVADHRAAVIVTTPVVVQRLAHLSAAQIGAYDLSSLRAIAVSGSAIAPDIVHLIMAKYGPVLYSLYGSTEVGYAACAGPEELAADPACAGVVLPGVTVEIRGERGVLGANETGGVFAGSAASFSGYLDGSDRGRIGGLIDTGDIGRLSSSGILTILGRNDDVIICGGENVHPSEVETVVRQHADVADAAVIGVPDAEWGQVPVAFVVPVKDGEIDAAEVKEWAAVHLAAFQRPRAVHVVADLPRNATGKVVRAELPGLLA